MEPKMMIESKLHYDSWDFFWWFDHSLTGWAAFLRLGWTPTAGTSRRIWEEDPANQTVYAGGELVKFHIFGWETSDRTDETQRGLIRFTDLIVFFWFISVLRAFGGSRMALTSSLWCSLRSVQEIGKMWCFSDLKDTVELVLQICLGNL